MQPTGSDLHVNVPLTNISVAYMQDQTQFIADRVFPVVPVQQQSNLYYTFKKGPGFRAEAKPRAPATESAGRAWQTDTDQYACQRYSVHQDIADEDRANADALFDLDREASEGVTDDLLLLREILWADRYFQTGVWATDLTGDAAPDADTEFLHWDDEASTPIQDIRSEKTRIAELTGRRPNTLVLGPRVRDVLVEHPDVKERVKYTQTAVIPDELLASLLGVERLFVPEVVQNTAAEGATDAMSFLYGKSALLVYAAPRPALKTPSGGYTFAWTGLLGASALGSRMKRFRMDALSADRVEGDLAFDMKVVADDLGVFFSGAIS